VKEYAGSLPTWGVRRDLAVEDCCSLYIKLCAIKLCVACPSERYLPVQPTRWLVC